MNTECTWGEGPDVLVVIDIPVLLLAEVDKSRTRHGICNKSHLDLTAAQAKDLAYKLLTAAAKADELTQSYIDYETNTKIAKTEIPLKDLTPHPYHCFECGHQLFELCLGGLICRCGKTFVPIIEKDGNPALICTNKNEENKP